MNNFSERVRLKIHALRVKALKAFFTLPEVELNKLAPPDLQIASPITEHFCMPPYYVYKHDDFTPLMKLAKAANPKLIVELGTAHGNTSANLALNCPNARIITVNAPVEVMTGDRTTFELTKDEIGIVYRNAGLSSRIKQVFSNTLNLDLSEYVKKGEVDFAIVDACHDESYVTNDFLKVASFLSPHGIILLHDTHPSMEDHLGGSYLACMHLRSKGYDIRHIEDTWWGIFSPDNKVFNRGV